MPPHEPDRERLSFVLSAARLGDFNWDAKSDVVAISARTAEICGFKPTALHLPLATVRELVHPDDLGTVRRALDWAILNHEDFAQDHRVIHGDRERCVTTTGRIRYDELGQFDGVFGVVQEITSDRFLVRVDDAVRPLVEPEEITYTAARMLGQHLGVNRCAYACVEPDEDTFVLTGNFASGVDSIVGRYRFRQFGQECLRLMRAGKPYIVNDSVDDPRVDDHDREAYRSTMIRAVICVPIVKCGRFVAAMAVHVATPRRWCASEVELVQQVASRCWESIERARIERERSVLLERAEAANRTKDEFLAMLGHELRNPLAPILTALHLMKLHGDAGSERERTVIERQVNHLTRLVDDLLDVARIARGKVILQREYVELSEVMTRALEVTSPLLEKFNHRIEVDVPVAGLLVHVDVERLIQVVSNLLTNAAKYTPSDGRIVVSASASDGAVVFRVCDSGNGMTPEVLEHAFDLFVQGKQASDRAHGGLGLGLTIARNIVELHGGSVEATSAGLGLGSELTVRLPNAQQDLMRLAAPAHAPWLDRTEVSDGVRVLVVDDNEDAADMLAMALTLGGCEVHVAHDGPEALSLGAARVYDIALLDIGLPVMDGYELAARLRALPHLETACLVAVTGYGQDSDRRRAIAAGFQDHLVKPVDVAAVQAVVRDTVARKRAAKAPA